MDGARDQFFSGAAFTGNQNPAGLRRDGLDHVEDGAHLWALPDDGYRDLSDAESRGAGSPPSFFHFMFSETSRTATRS